MRVGTRNVTTPRLFFAAIALVFVAVGTVNADTITVKDNSVNTSTGVFTYLITLDSTTYIAPGSGFTIYDFGGYVPNSATITPLTGGGTLGLGDFQISIISSNNSPNPNPGQGTALNNPMSVNSLVQVDANVHGQAPNVYPDPNSPGDGLSNPTFDNPATPNLNFIYDNLNSSYQTSGTETYLLTVDTSLINPNNQVSVSEVGTEDQDNTNFYTYSFAQNLVFVPFGSNGTTVQLPEPTSLTLLGLAGFGLLRRSRKTR